MNPMKPPQSLRPWLLRKVFPVPINYKWSSNKFPSQKVIDHTGKARYVSKDGSYSIRALLCPASIRCELKKDTPKRFSRFEPHPRFHPRASVEASCTCSNVSPMRRPSMALTRGVETQKTTFQKGNYRNKRTIQSSVSTSTYLFSLPKYKELIPIWQQTQAG